MRGNIAQLMRLARSPWPLPLRSITARRSLLALENLSGAIETLLGAPGTLRRVFIAADVEALTVPARAARILALQKCPCLLELTPNSFCFLR